MVNNASVFSRLETIIMVNLVATFILLLMSEGVSKAQKRPQYKSKLATLVKYT